MGDLRAHGSLLFSVRVFSDRLVDAADMETFIVLLSEKLGTHFDPTLHNLCPNKRSPIFGMCRLFSGAGGGEAKGVCDGGASLKIPQIPFGVVR